MGLLAPRLNGLAVKSRERMSRLWAAFACQMNGLASLRFENRILFVGRGVVGPKSAVVGFAAFGISSIMSDEQ